MSSISSFHLTVSDNSHASHLLTSSSSPHPVGPSHHNLSFTTAPTPYLHNHTAPASTRQHPRASKRSCRPPLHLHLPVPQSLRPKLYTAGLPCRTTSSRDGIKASPSRPPYPPARAPAFYWPCVAQEKGIPRWQHGGGMEASLEHGHGQRGGWEGLTAPYYFFLSFFITLWYD